MARVPPAAGMRCEYVRVRVRHERRTSDYDMKDSSQIAQRAVNDGAITAIASGRTAPISGRDDRVSVDDQRQLSDVFVANVDVEFRCFLMHKLYTGLIGVKYITPSISIKTGFQRAKHRLSARNDESSPQQ